MRLVDKDEPGHILGLCLRTARQQGREGVCLFFVPARRNIQAMAWRRHLVICDQRPLFFSFFLLLVMETLSLASTLSVSPISDRPSSLMTVDTPPFCLALCFFVCTGYMCPLSISIPSLFLVRSFVICPPSLPFIFFSLFSFSFSLFLHPLHPSTYFSLLSLSHHRPSLTLLLLLSPSLYTHSSPFPSGSSPPSPPLHSCCCHPLRYSISSSPSLHPHPTHLLTQALLHTPTSIHTYAFKLILTLPTRTPQPISLQLICTCTFPLTSRPYVLPPLSTAPYLSPSLSHPPALFINTIHLVFDSLSAPRVGVFPSLCLLYAQFLFFAAQRASLSPVPPN